MVVKLSLFIMIAPMKIYNMKYSNCFIVVFILIFQNGVSQNLLLKGKLTGFEDGTNIILNPFLDNMDIDRDDEIKLSLKNGEFEFIKHLDKPTKYSLRVRPVNIENLVEYEDLTFWAENTQMSLTGEKGQIFHSMISGSAIQDQYFEYVESVAKLKNMVKQIADSVKTLPNLSEAEKSKMRIRYNSALNDIEMRKTEFVYYNPGYYCTAPEIVFLITFFPEKIKKEKLNKFYNEMTSEIQPNVYGRQIKTFLGKDMSYSPEELKIGDYPHNFSLKDTDGSEIRFSSINSKLILLDFWGSGCGPCRIENKNYVKLYSEYMNKGLEIVSVSTDQSKKMLMKAMKEDKINWISLWDENKEIYRDLYQIKALPTSYLIQNGKILAINLRGEELRHQIEKVLNETKN